MKKTTTSRAAQGGADFRSLCDALELTPARIEVGTQVSIATVYRARRGVVPGALHLKALAGALGITCEECREAIERCAAARRAAKGAA